MQPSYMSVSFVWVSLCSVLVGITARQVSGAFLLGKQERGFGFLASKRLYEDRQRDSMKSRLRYTHGRSLGARLRRGGREARLLFLSTPGDGSLPVSSTSRDSRSVHVLAASLEAQSVTARRDSRLFSSLSAPPLWLSSLFLRPDRREEEIESERESAGEIECEGCYEGARTRRGVEKILEGRRRASPCGRGRQRGRSVEMQPLRGTFQEGGGNAHPCNEKTPWGGGGRPGVKIAQQKEKPAE
uniref:Uncharacterized protein n=1 Tax=Chromera velia CCMP2878 TaxID=1169474 RepID=A0A0G4GG96_9ALVE|eukprot:Cvel_21706.t1-p1 / transcript=Cvel_21706.t1 / gene=Cvel_21706 / organism=Chromera_velia_CCMP2878 / gene_product=hypothetical protein / transcript_product=hypothetical protein / location=Cvel_scaffold2059:6367-7482(+) / protein_length=242 / sequence_SO=supercontig / SO=protein_coding / is_pseudo=false